MVVGTQDHIGVRVPDQSLAPDQLQNKIEVSFVQHNDPKLLNDWPSGNFLQNRIDASAPTLWGESMLERKRSHNCVSLGQIRNIILMPLVELSNDCSSFVVTIVSTRS
jgi:hypothetical protein